VRKIAFSLVAIALVASACNKATAVTMTVGHVPSSVPGDVVTIPVTVGGIKIVKADGDKSGKSGHFHVFVDKLPPAEGKVIPKERGIVHTAESPIKLYGLTPGKHNIHIVLGNGLHERIDGAVRATVKVNVTGPGVQGTAAPTLAKGQDLVVQLKAEGVKIVEPGTEASADEGHFHILVDPASPPKAGEMIADSAMSGASPAPSAMTSSSSYMTGGTSQTIKGLTAGEHIIWVVLADKDHKAWKVPVMDKITVTVG
jgi:hypothetical protein